MSTGEQQLVEIEKFFLKSTIWKKISQNFRPVIEGSQVSRS